MMKLELYDALQIESVQIACCELRKLKSKLRSLIGETTYQMDYLLVEIQKYKCLIYTQTSDDESSVKIEVDPAARARLETEFKDLEFNLQKLDIELEKNDITRNKEKICLLKQIDFEDDYVIMDVYAKM